MIEILTHIELENYDFVDARIESFTRLNKTYLKQDEKTALFLKYIKIAYQNPEKVTPKTVQENFLDTLELKPLLNFTYNPPELVKLGAKGI